MSGNIWRRRSKKKNPSQQVIGRMNTFQADDYASDGPSLEIGLGSLYHNENTLVFFIW